MVRRLPAPKIRHSLWQRLLRRRQRDHAHRTKVQRDRATVASGGRATGTNQQGKAAAPSPRRKKVRTPLPVTPAVPVPTYIYLVRLIIGLLGGGAIGGTVLSLWQPPLLKPLLAISKPPATRVSIAAKPVLSPAVPQPDSAKLRQQLQQLTAQYPGLQLHLSVLNLTTGGRVELQAERMIPAASTIKIPILLALFQQIDRQQLQLNDQLTLEKSMIGGGDGAMSTQPVGSQFTVLESATKMIVDNDNTATNLLIKRLGGAAQLNTQFRSWGLSATTLKSPLPDFLGSNLSSPSELTELLQKLDRGKLLTANSRAQTLEILSKTKRNNLLPAGLQPTTKIAHKTGEIAKLVADVGLVELPDQQKYVVAAMVTRAEDSDQAEELIRQSSKIIYQSYAPSATTKRSP
jgi:beta-lactamase class A